MQQVTGFSYRTGESRSWPVGEVQSTKICLPGSYFFVDLKVSLPQRWFERCNSRDMKDGSDGYGCLW